jgi:uncharacterized protein (TIGR00730 family)
MSAARPRTWTHQPLRPCPSGERLEPLPGSAPKPSHEDAEAPERLRHILASPTYRRADEDPELLARDALRPTRLQLEFLKAELGLEDAGVRGTIVVFGGTRIAEPAGARRALEHAEAALAARPGDAELARRRDVARRRAENSRYYEVAREFGRLVGRSGEGPADRRLLVVTGGGPGVMEAANRGACEVGAGSIGLNITLPREQYPNPYVTPELCFRFRYFALRKMHFMLRARALVAFPGGYGTLDELFETLCLIQTRTIEPLPVILVGEAWWRRAFDVGFLAAEGVIDPEDLELFALAETAQEAWEGIVRWYAEAGRSLYDDD